MKKTYTVDTIRLFQLFSKITSIQPTDCFSAGNFLVFIIPKKLVAKAIGKEGKNIKQIRETLNREIKVIEEADSAETLIKNFLFPLKVKRVDILENNQGSYAEIEFMNRKDRRVLLSNQQDVLKCLKDVVLHFYPEILDVRVV